MPSLAVKSPSCRPSPSWSSIALVTIAVTVAPSNAVAPSIAFIDVASRSCLPLPSRCRCAVQRVTLPSRHPSPSPLRRRGATFPLSLLVDCCLFTPPPLPSRLPSPPPSSTLRHRRVIAGEAIVIAVIVINVLPSPPPPPAARCLPSLHPPLVDCYISVDSLEIYMLK